VMMDGIEVLALAFWHFCCFFPTTTASYDSRVTLMFKMRSRN